MPHATGEILVPPAQRQSPKPGTISAMSGNGNGSDVAGRVSTLERDHAVTRASLDSLRSDVAELSDEVRTGFKSIGDAINTLRDTATTQGLTANRPTWQGLGSLAAILMMVGSPVVTLLVFYVNSQLTVEKLEREYSDEMTDMQSEALWEMLRLVNPTMPDYPFGE